MLFSEFDGKYSQISFPSDIDKVVVDGVNPQGTALVGSYSPVPFENAAAFVYQNGALTTLEFPGATITNGSSVNRYGEVGGLFTDSNNHQHGFIWTPAPAERANDDKK